MTNTNALRLGVLGTTAILILSACSSGGASPPPRGGTGLCSAPASAAAPASPAGGPASSTAPSRPRTRRPPPRLGGVDAVCAAGKAEGQLNLIATPPDWANYGQMITDFQTKYGIKIKSDQPDVDSQKEINAVNEPRRAPAGSPTSST